VKLKRKITLSKEKNKKNKDQIEKKIYRKFGLNDKIEKKTKLLQVGKKKPRNKTMTELKK
jgi:hypothetical protein